MTTLHCRSNTPFTMTYIKARKETCQELGEVVSRSSSSTLQKFSGDDVSWTLNY